ncbi:hypothetical protein WN51_14319 [Melipona quadrifasciata]|uniref:Uncharacterized protein n=1 Tax=Melipona quadrifasciata TaxID=166423 RepID=A0A0N0BGW8_9HYME|nr:hypothetical protein WN51_14319 [Melipona quadrifasciata]
MEQTSSSDLQQFIEERDRVKAALMRSKTFYDTQGHSEPVDALQERFDDIRPLLDCFEAIQDRIIDIVEGTADKEAHEQCRVEFENVYYRLLGAIQERINTLRVSTTSSKARHSRLTFASSTTSETPLPEFDGYRGEWARFRDRFEFLITRNVSLSDLYRCFYLKQAQQQRGADHRTDEVSTAKPNLLSPIFDGSTDLIGDKLDLLTDLPNNLSNGEPLINNDAQETSRNVAEKEEVDIQDETTNAGVEVTHGTHDIVTSIDATTFLLGAYTRKPENLDDSDDQLNASSSSPANAGARRNARTFRTIANIAGDLTLTSPTATPTAHQSHYRGSPNQVKQSPKRKSARNRQQAHRDDRCQLNRLRTIGNTCSINSAIRSLESITRKEVLRDDNEHPRNRTDNIANVPRRHSKMKSVARRNYASAGIQPVARASATIETVPTTKLDSVNDRRRNSIADRATRVQRQPRFVRRVDKTFRGVIWLIAHDPSYNAFARIDTRTLRNMFFPRTFDLPNSTVNRIDSSAFLPLQNLHNFEPSKNRLHNLGAQLFSEPYGLNRLTLSGNSIATLKPLAFRDCSNSKELYPMRDSPRDLALLKTLDQVENRSSLYNSSFRNLDQLIGCEPLLPDIDDAHYANDSNIIKLTMMTPEARDNNYAGGFLAANYGKHHV